MQVINLADIFFWVGVVSTVFFILKLGIYLLVGGFSELTLDFNTIGETDTSFDFLSVEAILSFLMGFGWVGFLAFKMWKFSLILSILVGVVFGILLAVFYTFLMFSIKKLDKSPKLTEEDYLVAKGKAYTNIPAGGEGQAELEINRKLNVVHVFNNSNEEISAFTQVKVVKYENSKIYVEKE